MSMSTQHRLLPPLLIPNTLAYQVWNTCHKGRSTQSQKRGDGVNANWVAPSLVTEEWFKHCSFPGDDENEPHACNVLSIDPGINMNPVQSTHPVFKTHSLGIFTQSSHSLKAPGCGIPKVRAVFMYRAANPQSQLCSCLKKHFISVDKSL